MKKLYFLSLGLLIATVSLSQSQDHFPQATITNKIINARLYLPNTETGYYRGSRFDWAGVIPSLEWNGHQYFGQWFETYRPTLHDAIMGPVEAFAPIGYEEAKVGEKFLVIGIGMVIKPEEPKYAISTEYQQVNTGSWKIKTKKDHVDFTHRLNDMGYGYEYKKTVKLIKGKPELVLTHSLKNTGTHSIETTVYNHNFFVMDHTLIGPAYEVKFPYRISGEARDNPDLVKVEGNHIVFVKDIAPRKNLYFEDIGRHNEGVNDYDFQIENHKTGAGVKISGDQPIYKLPMWSAIKTLCPEPYIKINIKPGETFNWTIRYEFYQTDISK